MIYAIIDTLTDVEMIEHPFFLSWDIEKYH